MKIENSICVEDYNRLRDEVKWGALPEKQAQIGLDNSNYIVACIEDRKVVGTARILWDGGYMVYLCDVMVSPEYQQKGIGKMMIQNILDYIKRKKEPEWKIMIALSSAKGKEGFYQKFGFSKRPDETLGAGLSMWI